MGQYLDTDDGGYYARGESLTATERCNFVRGTQGTRISRLAKTIDDIDGEDFFENSFITGVVILAVGVLITAVSAMFSNSVAMIVFTVVGCLALLVGLGVPILLFFAKVSSEISQEHWIRPRSYWRKHLEAPPNVLKLDGEGVRPAVKALVAADWFKKNARYGDAINSYLDNPHVQEVEADLKALGSNVKPEVRQKAQDVLRQLADGYVYDAVREIEQAEKEMREEAEALERDKISKLNLTAEKRLDELSKSMVMPRDINRELR